MHMIFWDLLRSYSWKYWTLGAVEAACAIAAFHYTEGSVWYRIFIAMNEYIRLAPHFSNIGGVRRLHVQRKFN